MRIIKHLAVQKYRLYLGGFAVVWKGVAVARVGYEDFIGVFYPFQRLEEGVMPRGLYWKRYRKVEVVR